MIKRQQKLSTFGRFCRRISLIRLSFSLLSSIVFTIFTLIMLVKDWANSTHLYLVLGFVLFYIALFATMIYYVRNNLNRLNSSIKDYKSGLKILKALIRLASFFITISVLSIAVFSSATTFFRFIVLISSVIWAIFQIVFQLNQLIKRHKTKRFKRTRHHTKHARHARHRK